jgi:hypothetical protein
VVRALAGLTLALAAGLTAVAVAQSPISPTITPEFRVAPREAGTRHKPRNALVFTKGTVNADANATLSRLEYTIPPSIRIDGTGFKTCSADYINQNGDDGCPKGSKVGTGAATALLGPQRSQLNFDVEVYAAGPKALTIYLQTSLFNLAIPGTVSGRIVGFDIPARVQQPVPGLYSYVTSVTARLGKQKGIPASVRTRSGGRRYFASAIGCPSGRHAGKVRAYLAANPSPPALPFVEASATSPCRKP